MTALQLVELVTQGMYVLIFLAVAVQTLRSPTRARIDMALFFGATALIVVQQIAAGLGEARPELIDDLIGAAGMSLPYLLLRLVDDFSRVPVLLKRAAEAGLLLGIASFFAISGPLPGPVELALVGYFAGLFGYCAVAFVRVARRSVGLTRRRMEAVATGSFLLAAAVFVIGVVPVLIPPLAGVAGGVEQLLALGSGLAYFLGFAPPRVVRRAWQEPELRAFLRRASSLPRLPDTEAIVNALQEGAASTLGARAAIGLYDVGRNVLRFHDPHGVLSNEVGSNGVLAWRAFERQQAEYYPDPARANPALAAAYQRQDVASVIIAPISSGAKRLGALEVFTAYPPVFSEDDLELTQLFADQAAVILESRALIDEATRVRAHEDAARLKEDFLSAAAHDLKTPLTTLVAQAQFLERRARTNPDAPADLPGIQRIVREAKRLSALVMELLDASRLEQGQLLGDREPLDLVALAREVAGREAYRTHCVTVAAENPVVGTYDPQRIAQVLENLVENAVKYSPEATEVRIGVGQRDAQATLDVSDDGIGIPAEDLPRVFDRFYRAANVDDRRFAGMGLGLFICRGIVEQHGGRIWVESTVGAGSTFHVTLPIERRP